VNKEDENDETAKKDAPKSSSTQEPSERVKTSVRSGKQARIFKNLVKGFSEVSSILSREIRVASSEISRAVSFDVKLSEKRSKLNQALTVLGLTRMERHRATRKIASEPKL